MISALVWKEIREHRAIWLAMVVLTSVLGLGLSRLVAPTDPLLAIAVATLTNLGMAAGYGVVCGAMMLAGEHEGGTLSFLDIFLGRRGQLWFAKFAIGATLALGEALTVAFLLYLMEQVPPNWGVALLGVGDRRALIRQAQVLQPNAGLWFILLPVITLEAYAWGMFGSALSRRVLPAAAVSALVATPIWVFALFAPSLFLFGLRLFVALAVLAISFAVFQSQARDATQGPAPVLDTRDAKRQFLDRWDTLEQDLPVLAHAEVAVGDETPQGRNGALAPARLYADYPEARSPQQVLWWLTLRQAWSVIASLGAAALVLGFLVPGLGPVLWPLATLIIGVACGTATFAPEQRDLSYQHLAAQHFPLPVIWRFKTLFWLSAAILISLLLAAAGLAFTGVQAFQRGGAGRFVGFRFGALLDLLGPALYFGIWLPYGFCAGLIFVWLCRKTILALMLAGLASVGALGLWLPSLLCGGMSGWQVWVVPLLTLLASRLLVRAWAGGRIKERRPLTALSAFGAVALAWLGLNLGYRAFEMPDVGAPLDPEGFREIIKALPDNLAGQKLQVALTAIEDAGARDEDWLGRVAAASRLPTGMIETPRSDGQAPNLRHLTMVPRMTDRLRALTEAERKAGRADAALEHVAQILALSRNLRHKAPIDSYVVGIETEAAALAAVDDWLAAARPDPDLLRRMLDELNRHAANVPTPLDCLQTECFRAGGLLALPAGWVRSPERIRDRWLAGVITLSLELPWEDERKTRLWQIVWAGLFRALETPPWELPAVSEPNGASDATRNILRAWLPAASGPGASLTQADVARQLDASWLADEHLFASVERLRAASLGASWRLDTERLTTALALYQLATGKPAQRLEDLAPKYLPQLPLDPYSGQPYRYRISDGEHIDGLGKALPGQGVVWSTGPDGVDDGGREHLQRFPPARHRPPPDHLDLIRLVPVCP